MSLRWIKELGHWLKALFHSKRLSRELNTELEQHLEFMVAENIARGMSPAEARRAAVMKFGGVDRYAEESRESWGTQLLSEVFHDARQTLRQLTKSPGFTFVTVGTLAVAIAASTSIFSILHSVVLQPLSYRDSGKLVDIRQIRANAQNQFAPNLATLHALAERSNSLTEMAGYTGWIGNLTGAGQPERIYGNAVTENYFSLLGVEPMLGRPFLASEYSDTEARVMILTHQLWVNKFESDTDVLGRQVNFNLQPFTIIGVMPPDFRPGAGQPEAFAPLTETSLGRTPQFLFRAVGRLSPDATLAQAVQETGLISNSLAAFDPGQWEGLKISLTPLLESEVGHIKTTLLTLVGAVGFLLMVACVNIANLMLTRANTRQREIALKSALGASSERLFQQLLTESMIIALIGGIVGIGLAFVGLDFLVSLAPVDLPRLNEIGIHGLALGVSAAITLFTGIGFGILPALQARRVDLTEALKDGSSGSGQNRSSVRVRNALVVSEISLALILLAGAGLLMQTFMNLRETEMGYDGDVVYVDRIRLLPQDYPDNQSRIDMAYRTLPYLEQELEILHAAFASGVPYWGSFNYVLQLESRPNADPDQLSRVRLSSVTNDYFNTIGNRLIKGRYFDERDREDTPMVAIISEQFARQHFPDSDPIGERVAVGGGDEREWREIVGVTRDIRWRGMLDDPAAVIFVPYRQHLTGPNPKVVVRVRPGARNPGPLIAKAVHSVDGQLPIELESVPLSRYDSNSIAIQRFSFVLLTAFSSVALLLAVLGVYGVMSHNVNQRRTEIGVRIALGAQSKDIAGLVLSNAARLVAIGLVIGMAGVLALSRLLESMLHGIEPHDSGTLITVATVLVVVTILSAYLPTRRACRVDPTIALRSN